MAGYEDLAQLLSFGGPQQQAIVQSDPYAPFAGIPQAITQVGMSPGNYSMKDRIAAGLIGGLLGGGLSGLSQDYQERAAQSYQDVLGRTLAGQTGFERPSVLSPSLFSAAQNQAKQFGLFRQLQQEQAAEATKAEIIKAAANAKNPYDRKSILEMGQRMGMFTPNPSAQVPASTPQTLATQPGVVPVGVSQADVIPGTVDPAVPQVLSAATTSQDQARIMELANKYGSWDMAEKEHAKELDAARVLPKEQEEALTGLRKEFQSTQTFKDLETAGKGYQTLVLAQQDPSAVADLDFVYGTIQMIEPGLAVKGEEQEIVRKSGSFPEQLKGQLQSFFKGDAKLTPEIRQNLINLASRRYTQHADQFNKSRNFYETQAKRRGLPDPDAVAYLPDAPDVDTIKKTLGIKEPKQSEIPGFQAVAAQARTGAGPNTQDMSVVGNLAQGIAETPQAIEAMFSPSTYKEAFKDVPTGADTLGTGFSMGGGATTGAAGGAMLGAPFGPIGVGTGAVVGGLAGSTLGKTIYDSGKEAVKEGAQFIGQDLAQGLDMIGMSDLAETVRQRTAFGTDKTVLPTMNEIKENARMAGQGAGLGALAKVAGKVVKVPGKVTGEIKNKAAEIVRDAKREVIGIKPSHIEKSFGKSLPTYLDDAGSEVPIQDATQYKLKLDKDIDTLAKDKFFEEISTNPEKTKLVFDKKADLAFKQSNALHQEASAALKQITEPPPSELKVTGSFAKNADGEGGFLATKEDFKPVFDKISKIADTQPQYEKSFTNRVNKIIDKWNQTDRSYDSLQERKSTFGAEAKWEGLTEQKAKKWNDVVISLNRLFADTQGKAFDFAMQKTNPSKVGALAESNKLVSAYKNFEPLIEKKTAAGRPSLEAGLIKTPLSAIAKTAGAKGALRTAEGAQKVTSGADTLFGPLSEGASSLFNTASQPLSVFGPVLNTMGQPDQAVLQQYLTEEEAPAAPIATPAPTNMQPMPQGMVPAQAAPAQAMVPEQVAFNNLGKDPMRAKVVNAVMGVESNPRDPFKVSSKGAEGRLQIMPATAKDILKDMGIDPSVYDPKNIPLQTMMAEHYLFNMIPKMLPPGQATLENIISAYNAGPARISKVLAGKQRMPSETAAYTPKVMAQLT